MAAPMTVTIQNLNGSWTLDKGLSNEADPMLKLLGVPWVLRKAFSAVTLHVHISEYTTTDPMTRKALVNIELVQSAIGGGLAGTTEKRTLNWQVNHHKDYIFGAVQGWSHFIGCSTDLDGSILPDLDLQTNVENKASVARFLQAKSDPDGIIAGGFLVEEPEASNFGNGLGLWVHTFERSVNSGWTLEQVWGFELIGGQRYFTRRMVIVNSAGQYEMGRLVYNFHDD
ncbi:hypothetical protein N7499_007020 [Penicillium canescens]|uniref:Uncharacterized protein n=1 Tax=Penicillium canescens TaxID=5083 RepID=A0AAD6IGD1_PENCN|nr:uncharacterized protein N7446_002713 [Penicillium canescens]KAJ5996662.1 hypothetical protein N7522_008322 [Penicillium canescens]KAJ6044519.1 hypothetical protein N7460_005874 [Penicillium canescens]KAJ6055990.1 hypothetical protein N7444_005088 [Penicillium canescens]KAJ6074936.1 hypothetical protein N7446_002713 [Penicillium canescens]KAJ6082146.1 hypothetical protein N7499_007020 [Penicillium canescens]